MAFLDGRTDIEMLSQEEETLAEILVLRFIRTHLYPTDTPAFTVGGYMGWNDGVGKVMIVTTNLPDDMLYFVKWDGQEAEPYVEAYQQLKLEDLKVHN